MSNRPERVAHLMQREIAEILQRELRDPRIPQLVSVTDVEVSRDLSFARVFVSILESETSHAHTLAALNRAAGFVRHALSPRLGLREVPELRFVHDPSLERGARVEEILKKIERGEAVGDEDEGGS
ncbi:MAG TPA: 30S ribosome-binding factor RbfA [Candidatus Eisenbacteria bacterium]|nr:30S ribosome-binding factor RbfA [Candidatus Eisenbacteria bacterium]